MTKDNGVSYQPWLSLNRVKLRIISQFWILSWNWERSLELEKNVLQDIDPWWRCCGRWWGTGLSSTSLTQRATRPWCTRPWRTSRGRLRSVKILLYYSSSTMQSTMSLCTMYIHKSKKIFTRYWYGLNFCHCQGSQSWRLKSKGWQFIGLQSCSHKAYHYRILAVKKDLDSQYLQYCTIFLLSRCF